LKRAVVFVERFADGEVDEEELRVAGASFRPSSFADDIPAEPGVHPTAAGLAFVATEENSYAATFGAFFGQVPLAGYLGTPEQKDALICDIIRDIFANPFRPVGFDSAWRTSTAVAIAQGMYDSRDFSAMPILADALQDAGCDSDDILNHCRDASGIHFRGCWVVDLVLGRS
jgi:hypothetical protein